MADGKLREALVLIDDLRLALNGLLADWRGLKLPSTPAFRVANSIQADVDTRRYDIQQANRAGGSDDAAKIQMLRGVRLFLEEIRRDYLIGDKHRRCTAHISGIVEMHEALANRLDGGKA